MRGNAVSSANSVLTGNSACSEFGFRVNCQKCYEVNRERASGGMMSCDTAFMPMRLREICSVMQSSMGVFQAVLTLSKAEALFCEACKFM
jgi:hypothetical protein